MRVWKRWTDDHEQLEKLSVDDGRWGQMRWSIPVPHGGEWPYSFFQAVGSTLVYCYRCINVRFDNSLTSAAPSTVCKAAFIQDTSTSRETIEAVSAMGSWAQSLTSWLARSYLLRWIALQFAGPWWPRSCYPLCRSMLPSRVRS